MALLENYLDYCSEIDKVIEKNNNYKNYCYHNYFNNKHKFEHKIRLFYTLSELFNCNISEEDLNNHKMFVVRHIDDLDKIPDDTTYLGFNNNSNNITLEILNSKLNYKLKKNLKILDFGHNGIIYSNLNNEDKEQINILLKNMPNLTRVYYCDYYCQFDFELIKQVKEKYKGECVVIPII